ncbi:amino-acid N-acetyltransferase [Agaribacterium haliotis]|uniref:amino-acid N-acetyltransferase n=1 Tax=Agaribacterium haliotis TaxID=2013869 RepID=UPI000BB538E0|nr:amino-acid N-acetyltransferase [Agaribacterium haliotis]
MSDISWLRQASPYIHKHRGKIALIMLPGEFVDDDALCNITSDLALLTSLGIKLVLVHGARPQIEQALKNAKLDTDYHNGVRITASEHMHAVIQAVGETRFKLEAQLSSGLPNSAMHGSRLKVRGGNFVSAKPRGIIDGIDYQYTGEVRSVDGEGIIEEINNGSLALISPLGYSLTGEMFNVSFADVAVAVAKAVKADKLIAYNDDGRIRDANNHCFREMTLLQCKKFLVETQRHSESHSYFSLEACHQACDLGVPRAHIVSAREDGAVLKELFTRDGAGTMIYRDSYETIRRARIEDVAGILGLIEPLEQQGVLVKRSRELLETEISCFTVMEKDSMIIGCAALYPIANSKFAEIACVAMHPDYRGGGRASKLLTHVERQSARLGASTLFVLTTQTSHWFLEQGFIETALDMLPVERQKLYNFQRKSKVFSKRINVTATTIDLNSNE